MNGLNYTLLMTGIPQKELATELKVSVQLVASWVKGVKPIAEKHLLPIAEKVGVEKKYLQKELSLQDKIEIEMQLSSGTERYENVDFQAAALHKRNEAMKEKYMSLLQAMNDATDSFGVISSEIETVQQQLMNVLQVESIAKDPNACEALFGLLKNIQVIRKHANG